MKAMPTLQGGLRIDAEDASDWEFLRAILSDAGGDDLAERLGRVVTDTAVAEDWREFVVPDLREGFQDDLARVGAEIESAIARCNGEAGPLWITPDDAAAWYSALNQARLALEETHRFGQREKLEIKGLTPERQAAFVRTRFYCAIQGLLLEYVMK